MLEWPSVGGLCTALKENSRCGCPVNCIECKESIEKWLIRSRIIPNNWPKMPGISIHFRIFDANGMLAAEMLRSNSFSMNSADTNGNQSHPQTEHTTEPSTVEQRERKKNRFVFFAFVRSFVTSFYLWEDDDFFFFLLLFGRRLFQTGFRLFAAHQIREQTNGNKQYLIRIFRMQRRSRTNGCVHRRCISICEIGCGCLRYRSMLELRSPAMHSRSLLLWMWKREMPNY